MTRIEQLEECLMQFQPFAKAVNVRIDADFACESPEAAAIQKANFLRDTLYFDEKAFHQVGRLLNGV